MSCPFMSSNPQKTDFDPDDFDIQLGCPITFISQVPDKYIHPKLSEKSNQLHLLKYPIYLKNTLFHPLQLKKIRNLEIIEKLMPFNDFKKEGNKNFHHEELDKAIDCYEHSYGIYKYLEIKNSDQQFNPNDINVVVSEPKNAEELNFRNSALACVLNNLAITFAKLHCFDEALMAVTEALEYRPLDPGLLVKRAKIKLSNLNHTNLEDAYKDIQNAVKINPKYTFMLNKYTEVVNNRNNIKKEIIEDIAKSYSKFDWDYSIEITKEKELEHKIIEKMEIKYYEMIEFYLENNKFGNLIRIREEMKTLLIILYKMNFIFDLNPEDPVVLNAISNKIENELDKKINTSAFDAIKRTHISLVFNEGKFNEQLLSYCMEKCSEEERIKSKLYVKAKTTSFSYFQIAFLGVVIALIGSYFFIQNKFYV